MFIDQFQEEIWTKKYQYNNETFEEFCMRVAGNIFPEDVELRDRLIANMLDFKNLFGGRINSNIGISERGLTLFNCFIESIVKNPDSIEGIMEMLKKYILTLKTEGGVGFCGNFLRPRGTVIRKIGVTTPGAIKFLELFDKASEVITSGDVDKYHSFQGVPTKKSIRKGATMVTLSVNHPDIEEFITAKSIPNRLTKMNMSVLITNAFMYAVENDLDWDLWYPDINFEKYDSEWDGDFEKWAEKGYPYVIYKKVRACELWDLLLKNMYNRNEPGIIFIDNTRLMDNLHYVEGGSILSTNPCGEVPGNTGVIELYGEKIEVGDVCNLGSINLTRFYDIKTDTFDMESFKSAIDIMVRALDNIIDISDYPLEMYENAGKLKRKIGVGIVGVGSFLMMKGVRYGSRESLEIMEQILNVFINKAYQTSALLAKEKGPFLLYDKKLLDGGFVKHGGVLTSETKDIILRYGLRNSALSAIAPNGTLAIVAGNVSGGLEPVFSTEYSRWKRVESDMVGFTYPNVQKGEWFETDYFKEIQIADESVLMSTDNNYRIDKNTGLCKRESVIDYGYKKACEFGKSEFTTAKDLTIEEHLNVLALFSKYIDQSSSKCIALGSRIYTDNGVKKIGDLSNCRNDGEFSGLNKSINVKTIKGEKQINSFYYNGVVSGKKVLTAAGMELSGSDVHKIKVINEDYELEWRQLKELKVGDIVPIQLKSDLSSETTISKIIGKSFKKPGNCKHITIPTQLSSDLLWWLGCVYADGHINSIGVHLTQIGGITLDKFIKVSETLFNANVSLTKDSRRDNLFKASINSKVIYEWMTYINFSKNNISDIVFCASPLMKKAFIEGITLDGYISDRTVCLKTDKTLELIKDLQIVCLAVGIPTHIQSKYNSEYDKYYYDLIVPRDCVKSMSSFVFPEKHKHESFIKCYNGKSYDSRNIYCGYGVRFPISERTIELCGNLERKMSSSESLYNILHRINNDAKKYKTLTLRQLFVLFMLTDNIPEAFSNGYYFTEVSDVMDIEIETADIEVDEEHNYIANGFLSHNTINLPNDVLFEDFKNLYGNIHKLGIKGCTTYREGTSVAVLEAEKKQKETSIKQQQEEFLNVFKDQENGNIVVQSVKLPEEYPAKGYILRSEGKKWYIHVAFKDKACTRPFAIFVNTNNREDNVVTFNALEKMEEIALSKGLNQELVEETKRKYAYQKNPVKICRMLGLLLRHNIDVYTIVKGLNELDGAVPGTFVFRMKKFLSQFVQDHDIIGMACPDCHEKSIVFTEGCVRCSSCSWSKCG